MTFYYWEDARGEWRWHLVGANLRVIAISPAGYANESDCLDAIILVKSAKDAPIVKRCP
jgi:uncharacterized protein YegP (UPF0339 family)